MHDVFVRVLTQLTVLLAVMSLITTVSPPVARLDIGIATMIDCSVYMFRFNILSESQNGSFCRYYCAELLNN